MRRLARPLPRGVGDLLRQLVLFAGAYAAYRLVRGMVVDDPSRAFEHARALVTVERASGVFTEPAISAWAYAHSWLVHLVSWSYLYLHFVVTTGVLAWVYLRRPAAFPFVRNMFLIAMALALVLYLAYPTAPPRLLPELGFPDPVADVLGVPDSTSGALANPYAAVPSMHVAFSLMVAGPLAAGLVRNRVGRALWIAYPVYVTFVVVSTANHWWFDAVTGALVAVAGAAGARALAAVRPQAWALAH